MANMCRNPNCKHDFPHYHSRCVDNLPARWEATIEDPPTRLRWPESLNWEPRRKERKHGLFQFGWFASHSKFQLPWKLDLAAMDDGSWGELASLVAWKFAFSSVYGIPKGGVKFAQALQKHCEPGYPVLIVDDVLTTGRSFIHARAALGNPENVFGVVVAARGACPDWVFPILTVNEWAQSRATGLG